MEAKTKNAAPQAAARQDGAAQMPALLKEVISEQEQRETHARQYAELKERLPEFDFAAEAENPLFVKLLKCGVDMDTAYRFIHNDEIFRDNAQKLIDYARRKTLEDIAARGARPAENGVSGQSAALSRKREPGELDKKERERIGRALLRGEKYDI